MTEPSTLKVKKYINNTLPNGVNWFPLLVSTITTDAAQYNGGVAQRNRVMTYLFNY